jgi:hypothetical protein
MQAVKSNRSMAQPNSSSKIFSTVIILVVLLVIGIYANNAYQALQPASLPQGTTIVSQSMLEEKYGLHVNLVAVTGAGGFVDVRLKIVDGDKAKLLLGDKKNFPVIFSEHGFTLNAPEDTKSQKIEFISNGNLFIMYPNSGNTIQRAESATLLFGNVALEPLVVK